MKVKYAGQPGAVKARIQEKDYLYGYALPERERYVVRWIDRPTRTAKEGEFDGVAQRWLSDEERLREAPEQRRMLAELGVSVVSTPRIDPETRALQARVEVFDLEGKRGLVAFDTDVYPPIDEPLPDLVASALKEADFPAVFAAWSDPEKTGYWAAAIHRMRRIHGEAGRDEDEIFTPGLVADCERLDPGFRRRLPDVLSLAARLEQTSPDELIRAFHRRVGLGSRPEGGA